MRAYGDRAGASCASGGRAEDHENIGQPTRAASGELSESRNPARVDVMSTGGLDARPA